MKKKMNAGEEMQGAYGLDNMPVPLTLTPFAVTRIPVYPYWCPRSPSRSPSRCCRSPSPRSRSPSFAFVRPRSPSFILVGPPLINPHLQLSCTLCALCTCVYVLLLLPTALTGIPWHWFVPNPLVGAFWRWFVPTLVHARTHSSGAHSCPTPLVRAQPYLLFVLETTCWRVSLASPLARVRWPSPAPPFMYASSRYPIVRVRRPLLAPSVACGHPGSFAPVLARVNVPVCILIRSHPSSLVHACLCSWGLACDSLHSSLGWFALVRARSGLFVHVRTRLGPCRVACACAGLCRLGAALVRAHWSCDSVACHLLVGIIISYIIISYLPTYL